jgi:ribosomal protein L40E
MVERDRVVSASAASPSCPRCGAESSAGAARCRQCGFAFLEDAERRRLPRPNGLLVALVAGAVVVVLAVALIAERDAQPRPPTPVPALEAERRLELRYGGPSDDETAAVRCPRPIEPNRTIRCELRYRDGVPRALLVRLSPRGELEADVPYPATLRE